MYDEDNYGDDQEIGSWSIKTKRLYDPQNKEGKAQWCQLSLSPGTGNRGSVQIEVQFLGDWETAWHT
jgi:hypothetical protein